MTLVVCTQADGKRCSRSTPSCALLFCALVSLLACSPHRRPGEQSTLTRVAEVRRLGARRVGDAHPVRLAGVVTYRNPLSKLLVIQDPSGGIPVDLSTTNAAPSPGQVVQIEGFAGPGDSVPVVLHPKVSDLGAGRLPNPQAVSWKELASGSQDYRWVEAGGIVRSAKVEHDGSLTLDVVAADGRFTASVLEYGGLAFSAVVDARVRIRGVAVTLFTIRKELLRSRVLVPSSSEIAVDEPAAADPFSRPIRSIRDISGLTPQELSGHRVRVRGRVASQKPGAGLEVADGEGRIRVRPARMIPVQPGDPVDVVGFPLAGEAGVHLEEAILRRVITSAAGAPETPRRAEAASPMLPGVLTRAAQIRSLTPAEADRGHPVRLRAVVTYYDPAWAIMFVQDPTGGIYVDANGQKEFPVTPGQTVEVEGATDSGGFAPQIASPRVRALGAGSMPSPLRVPIERLFTGQFDSQWVEAEGVVQSVKEEEGHLWLDVVSGLYRFQVHTADSSHRDILARLVDSHVRVQGASSTVFNSKRQLTGIEICAPDLTFVSIQHEGPADPFSIPLRPVSTLLQFSPKEEVGHRVRVQGIVALARSGTLFLQGETGSVMAGFDRAGEPKGLRVGDQVDVVGFPAPGNYTPVLQHSIFRRVGSGGAPAAVPVTAEEALAGNYDAQLVTLEANLLDRVAHSTEQVLTLQSGRFVFGAHLEDGRTPNVLAHLRSGSLVRLTGVCSVQVDSSRSPRVPRSFRILLRSAEDVAVIEDAPWWTPRHSLGVGALMAAGLSLALAWAVMLRRQVRRRTRDIQARLEREAALEERYRDLFEHANDVIFSHDLQGRLTSFNQAAERLAGRSRQEALGTDIATVLAPGHAELVLGAIAKHTAGEPVPAYELELLAEEGRRVTLEVNSRLILEDGQPVGVECIGRDITERKQFEQHLRQMQKIEAVGRLAGGVAHDFNNILSVITGYGELLLRRLSSDHALRPKAEQILKAAHRGGALTRQLLAFSRKQVLEPKILDLNLVVTDMEEMLRRLIGEDIRLVSHLAPHLGTVRADPNQVEQVLLNLVVNARDAMPDGGTVTVETANMDLDDAYVRAHPGSRPGAHVMLAVTDRGTGMDAQTISRVFEPFFTTKEQGKGTGLGLATVYGIVKQSEGYISLASTRGRGTRFEIYLQRIDEVPDTSRPAVLDTAEVGSETILLVEDDEEVRSATREMLEGAGYTVLAAGSGAEALEASARHRGPIHVVVTDVIMSGINGPELARRLALTRPEAKVLYVSGYTHDALTHVRLGAQEAFLSKPLTSAMLCRKVRALLHGVSPPAALGVLASAAPRGLQRPA